MMATVVQKARRAKHLLARTGLKYQCPFCGGRFRKLDPRGLKNDVYQKQDVVPEGYRENATCPRCLSSDRERLAWIYIKTQTELLKTGGAVLHVAPDRNLADALDRISGVAQTRGDKFTKGYEGDFYADGTKDMDVTKLRLPEKSFSVVLCNHVLEHVIQDRKALREIFRVLKPGGWAMLQVPVSHSLRRTVDGPAALSRQDRERRFGQFDHVRMYARQDYPKRIEEAGFEVDVIRPASVGIRVKKYALHPREELFIARRPL
jgi:SAM-dependent methyltransferase